MKIAELFVALGVKGGDTTKRSLEGVKSGMGEIKSMSLEAKAAIVGVVYALEKMMSASAKKGTNLLDFATLTGLSTKQLQQWQYAAIQAGGSAEDLQTSVRNVQQSMTNMQLGKGAPEGIKVMAEQLERMGEKFDFKRAGNDPFYVMTQAQKFLQSDVPARFKATMARSLGLSDGTMAAMMRGAFSPDMLNKAPVLSDNQIGQLNKVDVAWKNLGLQVERAFDKFTSKHGLQIASDIGKITVEVFKLVDGLTRIAEKLKVFEGVGMVFEGWGKLLKITEGQVDNINEKGLLKGTVDNAKNSLTTVAEIAKGAFLTVKDGNKYAVPNVKSPGGKGNSQTNNINQTFVLKDKDPREVGKHAGSEVKKTFQKLKNGQVR